VIYHDKRWNKLFVCDKLIKSTIIEWKFNTWNICSCTISCPISLIFKKMNIHRTRFWIFSSVMGQMEFNLTDSMIYSCEFIGKIQFCRVFEWFIDSVRFFLDLCLFWKFGFFNEYCFLDIIYCHFLQKDAVLIMILQNSFLSCFENSFKNWKQNRDE
jgi:hypothetical protein